MIVLKKRSVLILIVTLLCVGILFCAQRDTTTSYSPKRYTVVIDAGHGGIDGGATGIITGNKESDINLDIAFLLGELLLDTGINVVYTRETQDGLYGTTESGFKRRDMLKRREIILSNHADMVISIHMNKFSLPTRRGAQVYFQRFDGKSLTLANAIQNTLNTFLNEPQQNRAFSPICGDFWMCKIISPAVIVECGFLSNKEDDALFHTLEHRKNVAYYIFNGILSYLLRESVLPT